MSAPTRRRFLQHSAMYGAAALTLGPFWACSSKNENAEMTSEDAPAIPGLKYRTDPGLQLYTLRAPLAENPRATLEAVKKAGYVHVELMDTGQIQTLKPICDDLGLEVRSSFYNWLAVTGNGAMVASMMPEMAPSQSFEQMVEEAAKAGLSHMVFGYMLPQERSTLDDYKLRAEQINKAAELVKAAGMQQVYHHHSFEFAPLDENGTRGWDILVEQLDPNLTPFEIDVFWAAIGGEDPAALISKLKDRTRLLHLKDLKQGVDTNYNEQTVDPEAFQELGDGRLDFNAILAAAEEAQVAFCMVEQDQSPDPLASIAQSSVYLLG